jgi:two-component system, cell cycle response regulator
MRLLITILISLFFTSVWTQVFAQPVKNSLPTEQQINLQPLQSYQAIMQQSQHLAASENEPYLWLLLRKAQAENLLYFHQQFEQTVAQAQLLISDLTPNEISSHFLYFAGIIAQRKTQYNQAIALLKSSMASAKAGHLTRLFILAKQELAYTRSLIELYESSLNEIQQAYVEAFSLDDQLLMANTNETYAAIYGYIGDYAKSIDYYEKALQSYQRLGYPSYIAEAIYGLAATYRYWKKYDLAIEQFTLYQQSLDYTPNEDINYFAMYGLGMTFAEQGDCERAIITIDNALALHGQPDYNAELYKRKASCLIQLKQLTEAKQALAQAIEILAKLPELAGTTWQLETDKITAQLAHEHGDNPRAYQLLVKYYEQYIELMDKNADKRLLNVRSALELERRDGEISLMQQQSQVRSLKQKQQQQRLEYQQLIMIVVMAFSIMLITFLTLQYRTNKKIAALSIKDPMSLLYNRRYAINYLADTLKNFTSEPANLALLLIDIDDFRKINERYGQLEGDSLIQKIGQLGLDMLRAEDMMSRFGGDEFLCVLPRLTEQQTMQVAQRMLSTIAQLKFATANAELIKVTASIGVVYVDQFPTTVEQLINWADTAMIQAKKLGKNHVCRLTDLPHDYQI